jgi:hypothetical protein
MIDGVRLVHEKSRQRVEWWFEPCSQRFDIGHHCCTNGIRRMTARSITPAGLALDAKNHILFVCCRNPTTCVILNADDGTILSALPIGQGVDAAEFNPSTMEAFVSTLDGKTNQIFLITSDRTAAATPAATASTAPATVEGGAVARPASSPSSWRAKKRPNRALFPGRKALPRILVDLPLSVANGLSRPSFSPLRSHFGPPCGSGG